MRFATTHSDGSESNIRYISLADIQRCRFSIIVPEHYRDDGSCKCNDAEHRKMMIRDWEYSRKDFRGIPLKGESSYE